MNDILNDQIAEARRAKEELEAETRKRILAAALPELEKRAAKEKQKQHAQANFERTRVEVAKALETMKPEAEGWQTRFFALVDELNAHITKGGEIESRLMELGRILQTACIHRAAAEGANLADELFFDSGLEMAWREIGGMDSALDLVPDPLDPNSAEAAILKLYRFRQVSGRIIPALLSR